LSVRAAGSQQLARSFRSPSQLALRNDRERSAQIYLLVLQRFVTSILTVANRVVDFGVQRICHDTSLAVSVVRGVIIDSRYPGKAVRLPRMLTMISRWGSLKPPSQIRRMVCFEYRHRTKFRSQECTRRLHQRKTFGESSLIRGGQN
jgi:hypothetical protein